VLVYDHNGSWSEAPADWAVPAAEALGCARNFIQHGTPDTESVLFEPDWPIARPAGSRPAARTAR